MGNWAQETTSSIENIINQLQSKQNRCSLMLTGGNTAKELYDHWYKVKFLEQRKIDYYLGDERCVALDHAESNFRMVKEELFQNGVPQESQLYSMSKEQILPETIDILLLSVGEDGHIASLFPNSETLNETKLSVVTINNAPKPPPKRITITPRVIKSAKNIIVMGVGREKGKALAMALQDQENINKLPVRLTIGEKSTWILDREASNSFKSMNIRNSFGTRIIHA